ncbi:hypothetical protein H2248_000272 [Termitomyces sp. 'cryptogamus']|nr:hypothetical protein H2248_000272 [Termitomyces sp. 'cryptogamus']
MSGARPARPLEFSQPWDQWGLTTTIWTLMEECWIQNPENRPKTSQVIARLESEQCINPQSIDETNDPFPACFRQRMRHPMDPSDAYAILNRIHDPKLSDVAGIQSDLRGRIPELSTQQLHPVEPSASDQGSIPASSHWHPPDEAETRRLLEDIVTPFFQTIDSDDPIGIMIHDLQDFFGLPSNEMIEPPLIEPPLISDARNSSSLVASVLGSAPLSTVVLKGKKSTRNANLTAGNELICNGDTTAESRQLLKNGPNRDSSPLTKGPMSSAFNTRKKRKPDEDINTGTSSPRTRKRLRKR